MHDIDNSWGPIDDQIAELLGLTQLRVGRQRAFGFAEDGVARIVWVEWLWKAKITLASQRVVVLSLVDIISNDNKLIARRLALVADNSACVNSVIRDLVAEALQEAGLIRRANGVDCLDGVTYEIHIQSLELAATLQFCSPERREMVFLTEALLATAQSIVSSNDTAELSSLISEWVESIRGRGKER